MAEVFPFLGIKYNPIELERQAGSASLEPVIGPPYDVISPEQQDELYASSPFNFVRIMLNRAEPGDGPDEAYQRAAVCLEEWLASGIFLEDTEPAFYIYRQTFTDPVDGATRTRTGIFCALKLEPYAAGIVLPHEETRLKAKEDRLKLMRSTRSNPEPIFGLYEDPNLSLLRAIEASIHSQVPLLSATIEGDEHSVWRLGDSEAIGSVSRFFEGRRVWIADGHHRYETGLTYAAERRAAEQSTAPELYDRLLIVLTAFEDPGIVVLPTHRLVRNISSVRMEQLLPQLERYFVVEQTDPAQLSDAMAAGTDGEDHRFGMITSDGSWVLTLRDYALMDAAVDNHVDVWKRLDVSILQTLVLDRSLGIPAATLATTPDIGYTREWDEARKKVDDGEFQVAFLLNLPSADEVRLVAGAGDKMPPKSTFFYPKLWSGLILQKV